jgi:hypothetical protein
VLWACALAELLREAKKLFRLLAGLYLASALLRAGEPMECWANAGVPPVVRAEGFAELAGELVITCVGGDPAQSLLVDVKAALNVNVTSRIVSTSPEMLEALLLVDEPGLARVDSNGVAGKPAPFCLSPNPTSNAAATACNPSVADQTYQQNTFTAFRGTRLAGVENAVVWTGIPISPPGKDRQRTLRLSNVRVNASQLGASSTLITNNIVTSVSVSSASMLYPEQTVAVILNGLSFDVRSCDGANVNTGATFTQCAPTPVQRDFYANPAKAGSMPAHGALRFREGFQTVFKPQLVPGQATSDPGVVYNGESGFVRPETGSGGIADSATRLAAHFRNIPAGVRIFVGTTQAAGSTLGSAAVFVPAGADGAPVPLAAVATRPIPVAPTTPGAIVCGAGSTGAVEVQLMNGSGVAVWEVTAANPSVTETLLFTYAVAYHETVAALGTGEVAASLAPFYTASAVSQRMQPPTVPVPRFVAPVAVQEAMLMRACNVSVTLTSDPAGMNIHVDGVPHATPVSFAWAAGEAHTIEARPQPISAGVRKQFVAWSNGGPAQQIVVVPPSPLTLRASFVQQYAVAVSAGFGGSLVPSHAVSHDGYYDEGTLLSFEAVPQAGYVIAGWNGITDSSATPTRSWKATAPVTANVAFKPGSCAALVEPKRLTMSYEAAIRTVSVVRDPACGLRLPPVASAASWLQALNVTGESGRQSVALYAYANTSASPRSASVDIAGTQVAVDQPGKGCSVSLRYTVHLMFPSLTGMLLPENGASGQNPLETDPACSWTASSDRSWLQIYPLSGTGNADLYFKAFPNFATQSRTGTVAVANRTYAFTQDAAIAPTGYSNPETARYIRRLYYNYFGRLPVDAELRFHYDSGQSREQLALNFFKSAEFNNSGRFVAGLYVGLLNRDAEYGGWLYQRDALARNLTNQDAMVAAFLDSAEFVGKYGALSNAQFTTLLYQQILGWPPSPAELAWRESLLNSGFTRVAFVRDVLNSTEFRQNNDARLTAFLLFATVLNRDPTPSEFAQKRDAIALSPTDATLRAIIGEMVNSVELQAQIR